jgi:hypothetical protein
MRKLTSFGLISLVVGVSKGVLCDGALGGDCCPQPAGQYFIGHADQVIYNIKSLPKLLFAIFDQVLN